MISAFPDITAKTDFGGINLHRTRRIIFLYSEQIEISLPGNFIPMRTRQSKIAKSIFRNERLGRAILKKIHDVSSKNTHVVAAIKVNNKNIRINEL